MGSPSQWPQSPSYLLRLAETCSRAHPIIQVSLWEDMLPEGLILSGGLTLVLVTPTEQPEASRFVVGAVELVSSMGNIGFFLFPIIVGFLVSPAPPLMVLATISGATVILNLVTKKTGRAKRSAMRK